jgi:predicted ArsR family transcriptional regulator
MLCMTEPDGPDEFADINDAVRADWEAETTPYERVRQVISRTYTPMSADAVADAALTSSKTARKHLDTLADEGFVATEPGDYGGTHYRRSPTSLVVEQAADILEHVSTDDLVDRIAAMRGRLEEFRTTYGVESPEELTVVQVNQTLASDSSPAPEISPEEMREWQTTRRNLAFATAALSITNAERFVDGGTDSTDGVVPAQ